jgi:hypothetical protein
VGRRWKQDWCEWFAILYCILTAFKNRSYMGFSRSMVMVRVDGVSLDICLLLGWQRYSHFPHFCVPFWWSSSVRMITGGRQPKLDALSGSFDVYITLSLCS